MRWEKRGVRVDFQEGWNRNGAWEKSRNVPSLCVIVPAFNEAACIQDAIRQITSVLSVARDDAPFQFASLVVVDDGSADGTAALAEQMAQADPRVCVVSYHPNRGKGGAILEGIRHAEGDLVAFLDADMDIHPRYIFTLREVMRQTGADVVVGSKQHPDSNIVFPLHRKIYSRAYASLVQVLFALPVRDTQTGIKLFRREVLTRVAPRMTVSRFAFDLEMLSLIHREGFKIVEASVNVSSQRRSGRIGLSDILVMLRDTLRVRAALHRHD